MSSTDNANAALENRDWSTATVDQQPRPSSIVHSTRMSHDLTERLFTEAGRRSVTPSELIREYVEAGLTAAAGAQDTNVTVSLAELHRAIDTVVQRAA